MGISCAISEDDVVLILDALSAYRMLAESEMLSAIGDKRAADECSMRMSRASTVADNLKKAYFETLKGECPHAD